MVLTVNGTFTVDANGLPVALSLHPANQHEVTLVYDLVKSCWTEQFPERVIGDKAYDSDSSDNLDEQMAQVGVEMIASHKKNRVKAKTQDGRKLRRVKRRWKVERFFAHLQNYRHLIVRHERKAANFLGFVHLAAIIMYAKYLF